MTPGDQFPRILLQLLLIVCCVYCYGCVHKPLPSLAGKQAGGLVGGLPRQNMVWNFCGGVLEEIDYLPTPSSHLVRKMGLEYSGNNEY